MKQRKLYKVSLNGNNKPIYVCAKSMSKAIDLVEKNGLVKVGDRLVDCELMSEDVLL